MDENRRLTQQGDKSVYVEGNAYITYANERHIPHALTSPPFLPEVFLGRQEDLQHIHDRLFSLEDNLLLLVNGHGGIGKTSIAAKYYHTYLREYSHVAWVLSERSIVNALLLLAGPLGLKFNEQHDSEQRLEVLLMAMMALEKPCLLIVDNANELTDLEINYQRLRRCSNFHLILTTRITHFERAEIFPVSALPERESLALFEKYYRRLDDTEQPLFFQIREAVGENTLVLELLAKNLAAHNSSLKQQYSLVQLLHDLQRQGLFGLSHSKTVGTDYQSKGAMRKETPEAILAAMYDLSGLSREEIALLSIFAVLPAESICFTVLESLLPDAPALPDILLSVSQKGWIEHNASNITFKCSPVVQEVVRRKNPGLRVDCESLVSNLIDKLDYEGAHITGANYHDAIMYTRFAEAIVTIFESTPDVHLSILCERIGSYHSITGDLAKSLIFFERYTAIAGALLNALSDDPDLKNSLAISYSKLGETHTALGNLEQALTYFEERSRLGQELYAAYPQNVSFKNGLAISYIKLGWFYEEKLQNPDRSNVFYAQSKQLLLELVNRYPAYVEFKKNLDWVNRKVPSS